MGSDEIRNSRNAPNYLSSPSKHHFQFGSPFSLMPLHVNIWLRVAASVLGWALGTRQDKWNKVDRA